MNNIPTNTTSVYPTMSKPIPLSDQYKTEFKTKCFNTFSKHPYKWQLCGIGSSMLQSILTEETAIHQLCIRPTGGGKSFIHGGRDHFGCTKCERSRIIMKSISNLLSKSNKVTIVLDNNNATISTKLIHICSNVCQKSCAFPSAHLHNRAVI